MYYNRIKAWICVNQAVAKKDFTRTYINSCACVEFQPDFLPDVSRH